MPETILHDLCKGFGALLSRAKVGCWLCDAVPDKLLLASSPQRLSHLYTHNASLPFLSLFLVSTILDNNRPHPSPKKRRA